MRHNLEDKTVEALIDDLQKEAIRVSKTRINQQQSKFKARPFTVSEFLCYAVTMLLGVLLMLIGFNSFDCN